MAVIQTRSEPTMVLKIRIQIGTEWTEHCFGKAKPLSEAVEAAQAILDTFKDKPLADPARGVA